MVVGTTQQCLDNIHKIQGQPCSNQMCDSLQSDLNQYCKATDHAPGTPVPTIENGYPCYCCCGCDTSGMSVAVDASHYKVVEELVPGDTILAASVDAATGKLVWESTAVEFSQGAGTSASQLLMVMILFRPEGRRDQYLIVSRNQLFYMPDGTLRKAGTLVPGLDMLLLADGSEAPVTGITTGLFRRGRLHHIATSVFPATGPDGHLINIQGVVGGDYALQLSGLAREDANDEEALPVFGTEAYQKQYEAYITGDTSLAIATALVADKATDPTTYFQVLVNECTQPVNQYFFTTKQAQDIEANPHTKWRPVSSTEGVDLAEYLFELYRSYYPDIDFALEMENPSVNSFAVFKDSRKYVRIPKGLVNLEAVKFESLAVIIAHSVGCLIGGEPINTDGYPCTGQADYVGVDTVIRTVWYGSHFKVIMEPALQQLENIFQLIVPAADRDGVPGEKCVNIPTTCRMSAMYAAALQKPLPACAGG